MLNVETLNKVVRVVTNVL